ncbi:hypothetical protein TWF718_004124 [Orbilia javanica]|uniref:Uncharacterized protein n=1 Tax=Orbilia javanica TaxID=47235 RepID=A0AAN8MUJ4_9PEZI
MTCGIGHKATLKRDEDADTSNPILAWLAVHPQNTAPNIPQPDQPQQHSNSPAPTVSPPPSAPGRPDIGPGQDTASDIPSEPCTYAQN